MTLRDHIQPVGWISLKVLAVLTITGLIALHENTNNNINNLYKTLATETRIQYGTNHEYMSLDHQYDELWEDQPSEGGGYITIPGNTLDGEAKHGSITM